MHLTPREKTIIDFLAEVKSGREIANKLGTKHSPTEILSKLKKMGLIQRIDFSPSDVRYKATPWQNRPCVLGVRL
jgi:DNA-binding MarR family transcriptional regulator